MVRIVSWNVLYRKYEEEYNPDSNILRKYTVESDRVIRIVDLIKEQIDHDSVVCLQEVSFEIMNTLTKSLEQTHCIFSHCIRNDEFLVTVVPKNGKSEYISNLQVSYSKFNNTANGYLCVANEHCQIINCHLLPQRYAKANVMEYLASLPVLNRDTYIAGDFNEEHIIVRKSLDMYTCPYYGKTYRKRAIDHIIFTVSNSTYKTLLNRARGVSDHHMIILELSL